MCVPYVNKPYRKIMRLQTSSFVISVSVLKFWVYLKVGWGGWLEFDIFSLLGSDAV